jgi:single stranded DNA-binding protein
MKETKMANNLNHVEMEGRLVKAPEFKTLANGRDYATFSVALNYTEDKAGQKKDDVCYMKVEAWGQTARDSIGTKRGDIVKVMGHLKQASYVDKDGKWHFRVAVFADYLVFRSVQPGLGVEVRELAPVELTA